MFSLRQITCAGFLGVYPGCLTIAHNLACLPYQRGALIGVAFGTLTQVVITLLYMLIVSTSASIFNDPLLSSTAPRIVILAAILGIHTLSAVGCRIMGSYILTPKTDVSSFDRDLLEQKLKNIDHGNRSVVHDLVLIFQRIPPQTPRPSSWAHLLFASGATLALTLWQLLAIFRSFQKLWFESSVMDASWTLDLAFNMAIPVFILACIGFSWLFLSTRQKQK